MHGNRLLLAWRAYGNPELTWHCGMRWLRLVQPAVHSWDVLLLPTADYIHCSFITFTMSYLVQQDPAVSQQVTAPAIPLSSQSLEYALYHPFARLQAHSSELLVPSVKPRPP